MSTTSVFAKLAKHLRNNRKDIVCTREVLVERYDQTYGLQEARAETIEYVDLDALCLAIDKFAKTFSQK